MPEIETFIARAGQDVSNEAMFDAAEGENQAARSYSIVVRFMGGLSDTQKGAFKAAAQRWTTVITGAVPAVMVDGERIEGLLIVAQGANIDGVGKILGQAGPTELRPGGIGAGAFLPAKGRMTFDTADLANMETRGTLRDVIAHEMGHVIGIGTIWPNLDLVAGTQTGNPLFVGTNASREFGTLTGGASVPVPVENTGGPGTRDSHWRDAVFGNELMTGFVANPGNPLSRLTVASLQDIGYSVDMAKAEPYMLPSLDELAMIGALGAPAEDDAAHTLGIIPMTLPPESVIP